LVEAQVAPKVDWSKFTDFVARAEKDFVAKVEDAKPSGTPTQEEMFNWLVLNDQDQDWDRPFIRKFYLDPENEAMLRQFYNQAQTKQQGL
jgi:hypothetical protein